MNSRALINELCLKTGILPKYQLASDEKQMFKYKLSIANKVFEGDTASSKCIARELVARKAIDFVKTLSPKKMKKIYESKIPDVDAILEHIGIKDASQKLREMLIKAFTHELYQCLEFLGDSVLGMIISDKAFCVCKSEGEMTKYRMNMVNNNNLTEIMRMTGLYQYISHKINGDILDTHIPSDVFEAMIGAIYIDRGYEGTKQVLEPIITGFSK